MEKHYFRFDNVDFTLDTPGTKHQLHGGLIVLFQNTGWDSEDVIISKFDLQSKSFTVKPFSFTSIQNCDKPNMKHFVLNDKFISQMDSNDKMKMTVTDGMVLWKLLKIASRFTLSDSPLVGLVFINWSKTDFKTNIGDLPVTLHPVTEWSTIYTALKNYE